MLKPDIESKSRELAKSILRELRESLTNATPQGEWEWRNRLSQVVGWALEDIATAKDMEIERELIEQRKELSNEYEDEISRLRDAVKIANAYIHQFVTTQP